MGLADQSVTLTIDGQTITVEKGTTVLQAALAHGIRLPFFCHHPGLSVEGSCRACLVKIEKMPKLQTACSTTCRLLEGRKQHALLDVDVTRLPNVLKIAA